jgi:hypothetical protein
VDTPVDAVTVDLSGFDGYVELVSSRLHSGEELTLLRDLTPQIGMSDLEAASGGPPVLVVVFQGPAQLCLKSLDMLGERARLLPQGLAPKEFEAALLTPSEAQINPPRAAQGDKAAAQVLDSRRGYSEGASTQPAKRTARALQPALPEPIHPQDRTILADTEV